MGRTTTLQQPQPKQLHSTEDTSRPFSPQNHIIHHQTIKMGGCGNSNCTCSSCFALRAPAPATNKLILSPTDLSVPSPASTTWHSITSAFIIIVFLKKGKHVNGFL